MAEYQSERLILQTLSRGDAEELLDFYKRNREFHGPWEPAWGDSFFTLDRMKEIIENENQALENRSGLHLYLFKREKKKILGKMALSNIVYGVFQSSFVGYKIDVSEIKKGYGTEALKKLVDIAFFEYGLHRLEANIITTNLPSQALARKAGFIEEGLSRKYLKIAGEWQDHLHFVLINEEIE